VRVGIDSRTLSPCPQTAATGVTVGRKKPLWWEFILGTTIGAICIATALGTCLWCSPRLADKVASLPLVPVVVIMAIYIAVQAFVPAMNPSPRNSAGAC
jgi:hypothetical protein